MNQLFALAMNTLVYMVVVRYHKQPEFLGYVCGLFAHVATVVMFELADIRKALERANERAR